MPSEAARHRAMLHNAPLRSGRKRFQTRQFTLEISSCAIFSPATLQAGRYRLAIGRAEWRRFIEH